MNTVSRSIFRALAILFLSLSFLQAATTATWDGGAGGTFQWSDANNWNPDTSPGSGDALVFTGTVGNTNINNLTGNPIYSSLLFSTGTTPWVINNGTSASTNAFQVSGGITLAGQASATLNSNLTLTASQTIANSSANGRTLTLAGNLVIGGNTITVDLTPASGIIENAVTLNGVISGSGGSLIKDGTGTLTLGSGANSFTGSIQINGGTLAVGMGTNLGTGAGTTTVASGATLRVTGAGGNIAEVITISGSGATTGGGNLQRGALASFNNFGAHNLTGTVTLAGNTTVGMRAYTNFLTISGSINESSAGAGLNKVGSWGDPSSGFLKLTNANTYTGQTTVTGGGLVVNGSHGAVTSEATRVGSYQVTYETLTPAQTGTANSLTSQSVLAGTGVVYLKNSASVNLSGASPSLLATLAPGDVTAYSGITTFTSSIGTLVINAVTHTPGSAVVNFGANSQFLVQIDSALAGGALGANDMLSVIGGHIDLTGSSDYLVFNLLGAGTLSGDYVLATFDFTTPGSYGTFDNVIGLPTGYQVYYNATNITLGVVPEPATNVLLLIGLGATFYARRIRRIAT